jgi:hypothetical protein
MRRWTLALLVALSAGAAHALPVAEIGLSFTGPTFSESGFIPPDSQGAVGRDHVAVVVNGRYAVYDKETGAELASSSLNQFWRDAGVTPLSNAFDPRVLYDAASDRWFALAADNARAANNLLVAVSKSADPTDGWTGFAIDSDARDEAWADFPMLGIDAGAVYVSAPMFPVVGPDLPNGASFLVLPKDDLVAPVPTVENATYFARERIGQTGFIPQAMQDLDGSDLAPKFYAGTLTTLGQIQISRIDDPLGAPDWTGGIFAAIDPLPEPPDAEQPGPKQNLDSGDARFSQSLVLRNGVTWAVQSVDVDGRTAVRWIQLDPVNDIVLDWGVVADPNLDLIYPSIAVNELDQIVIGMTASDETLYPSAYAVIGEKVGGVTTFGDLLRLAEGAGSYEVTFGGARNRWGDYSATVADPEDAAVFWTFQEYVVRENVWGVRVTALRLVPEPGTALLVALGLCVIVRRRAARA